jgi:3-deoxy-D-manno-octulosonate 8-phosphate phosphatase (KDO 8-P phosphatase)
MITNFILDVDGVLTDGKIYVNNTGKFFKVFGAHDHDGLKIIKNNVLVEFVSADDTGSFLSKKRIVEHMKYKLTILGEDERLKWLRDNFDLSKVAYMGDGIYDAEIFTQVAISIAPSNARIEAKKCATYVTPSKSSEGAVLDACLYLKEIMKW